MHYLKMLSMLMLFGIAKLCPMGAGDLDTTFNPTGAFGASPNEPGIVTTPIGSIFAAAKGIAIQSNGQIVAAGYATISGVHEFALARYNADGSLDPSFGTSGIVTTSIGSAAEANGIAIQSDGKIVVAGYAITSDVQEFALARYNTNGSLDGSFGSGGIVITAIGEPGYSAVANAIVIQSDGKIVIAGNGDIGGVGANQFVLARYNTDGSLDSSFGDDGIIQTIVEGEGGNYPSDIFSLVIQTDGKIIAAGYGDAGSGLVFALARYNMVDGSLDPSFGTSGVVTTSIGSAAEANGIAIQTDGQIVVVGYGNNSVFAVVRYNTDGSLDSSFGTDGIVTTSIGSSAAAQGIALQSDGKIVAAGVRTISSVQEFTLVRYNTNGSLDNSFGTDGIVTTQIGSANAGAKGVAIQSDGKIVAAGGTSSSFVLGDFALTRYLPATPFITETVYCSPCGPIVLGTQGCQRAIMYQRVINGVCTVVTHDFGGVPNTSVIFDTDSITCEEFAATYTQLCVCS